MDSEEAKQNIKNTSTNNKMKLSFDVRFVVLLLLVVIVAMALIWHPWSPANPDAKNQIITVTGETTIKAVPDEFVFSPSYDFADKDNAKALSQLTQKSDELITKLEGLGVSKDKIATNSGGYDYSYYYDPSSAQNTYTLQLTIAVNNQQLAQKVQDYLVTTSPTGAISPEADFSEAKQKALESQGRDQATSDARTKAESTARNLGFTLGKVKSVSDNTGNNQVIFNGVNQADNLSADATSKSPGLSVQPGENNLPYSITVIYYVND
jgi:uncharacterized protein YggE